MCFIADHFTREYPTIPGFDIFENRVYEPLRTMGMGLNRKISNRLWNNALNVLSVLLFSLVATCYVCAGTDILITSDTEATTPPRAASGMLIAAIMSSDQPRYIEAHGAFVKSLASRGYSSASTEIIIQSSTPDLPSWSNSVRKVKTHKPDLIVAYGAPVALVAMRESGGTPVVAADFYDGALPTKGICGVSSRVPMFTLLKTLKDVLPYSRVGIIYNSRESGSQHQRDDIVKLAPKFGASVAEVNAASAAELKNTLHSLVERSDVIIATESSIVCQNFKQVITCSREHSIPVVSTTPGSAAKGALVSLEVSPEEQGQLAAEIAVRILEGATPDNLSLLKPRRINLVVNMQSAQKMGLSIPFPVLSKATRVIR